MSNHSIKFKGRLRSYLCASLYLIPIFVLLGIPFYFTDKNAGICISCFTGVYAVIVIVGYYRIRPLLTNELINFATQYGTVQKKLLNEFEIAYALLDSNGKIWWVNNRFEDMTGKDKSYHKSITSLFPSITKDRGRSLSSSSASIWAEKSQQLSVRMTKSRMACSFLVAVSTK